MKTKQVQPKTEINIRGLKHVSHTVFNVGDKGQKTYFDPVFKKSVPFASGQNIKRCALSMVIQNPEVDERRFEFEKYFEGDKLKQGKLNQDTNVTRAEVLLGGYMQPISNEKKSENAKKAKNKKDNIEIESSVIETGYGDSETGLRTITRRSPIWISAMTGVHPLLTNINNETIVCDRNGKKYSTIRVKKSKASIEELDDKILSDLGFAKETLSKSAFVPDNKRVSGIFKYDVVIHLNTLFTVSIDDIHPTQVDKLISEGWTKTDTIYGEGYTAPREMREKLIPLIADAILNWQIQSNQSTTYDPMPTIAVALSNNAATISESIYAELLNDENAVLKIDKVLDCNIYTSNTLKGYVTPDNLCKPDGNMIDAKRKLIEMLSNFNYENK